MALRAEQWMVVGFSAIGLFALYRLTKTTPNQDPVTPPPPYPSDLPILAGTPTPPMNVAVVAQGGPLMSGTTYQGRIETIYGGVGQPTPFTGASSREQIGTVLQAHGFDGIQVAMTPAEAAMAGVPAWALMNPGKGTRWFVGRWPGATSTLKLPILVWGGPQMGV